MKLNKLFLAILIFFMALNSRAQMYGSSSLPGLGGGTNANAALYTGDGVLFGMSGLFSSNLNAVVFNLSWNTGWNALGGKYSLGIAQPIIFGNQFQDGSIGITVLSPFQISWDLNKLKLQGNYSFLYGQKLYLNGHTFSGTATQYLRDNKYSLNGSIIYEHRVTKTGAERDYGDAFIAEANFSRHFNKGQTLGLIGYFNSNIIPAYVNPEINTEDKIPIVGLGADFGIPLGENWWINGKYIYDFTTDNSFHTHKGIISFVFKFPKIGPLEL